MSFRTKPDCGVMGKVRGWDGAQELVGNWGQGSWGAWCRAGAEPSWLWWRERRVFFTIYCSWRLGASWGQHIAEARAKPLLHRAACSREEEKWEEKGFCG